MDANSTELKSALNPLAQTRSSVLSIPELENQRILDTLCEILRSLIEETFLHFPEIRESLIIKFYTEIYKFMLIHNVDFDGKTLKYFEEGCAKYIIEFDWEKLLKKSLFSQWRDLFIRNSISAPESQNDFVDVIVKDSLGELQKFLSLAHEHLSITQFTSNIFPGIQSFERLFVDISLKLKEKTLMVYEEIGKRGEVENTRVQKTQVEDLKIKVENRTEWVNFSETLHEEIKVERQKCSIGTCCKRLFIRQIIVENVNCVYSAPTGWEITRVYTEITDGRFNEISIIRTHIKENVLNVEVEVKYSKYGSREVWFSLKVEGSTSRKKKYENKASEMREFLVIINQQGAHEIPE